jgi:hypothetical protein
MLLSKAKARNVSAPAGAIVSADAPPPWPDDPNVPAAVGLDGENGGRGELGSGLEAPPGACAVVFVRLGVLRWLDCATRTSVKACDSTSASVRAGRFVRCAAGTRRRRTGGSVRSVRVGRTSAVASIDAGRAGTTPASIRCTSMSGAGGTGGSSRDSGGGGGGGRGGGSGGGKTADCAVASAVLAVFDAAAAAAATFDWVTSPSSPGLAMRTETATLHWTHTDGTTAAGAGAPPGQSHCQFQTQMVDPGGGAGTAGAELGSQFQLQFQIQTLGELLEPLCA